MADKTKNEEPIRPELLDELLKGYQRPQDLIGPDGLFVQRQ
jgi:hypothetical protein